MSQGLLKVRIFLNCLSLLGNKGNKETQQIKVFLVGNFTSPAWEVSSHFQNDR